MLESPNWGAGLGPILCTVECGFVSLCSRLRQHLGVDHFVSSIKMEKKRPACRVQVAASAAEQQSATTLACAPETTSPYNHYVHGRSVFRFSSTFEAI